MEKRKMKHGKLKDEKTLRMKEKLLLLSKN